MGAAEQAEVPRHPLRHPPGPAAPRHREHGAASGGIILECVILLFQVVTLPVEIDASKRALSEVKKYKYLDEKEYSSGKSVLIAAALTYVASVASALIQILRLILVYGKRDEK